MHQFYVCGDLAPADLVFYWGFSVKFVRKQISNFKVLKSVTDSKLIGFISLCNGIQNNHISAICEGDLADLQPN